MLIRCNYRLQCHREQGSTVKTKDPEKKKDLGQVHKVYQRYIDTNKKVRTKMELLNIDLLISLTMKFWQWSLLIALVIVGFIINLLDKEKVIVLFHTKNYHTYNQ